MLSPPARPATPTACPNRPRLNSFSAAYGAAGGGAASNGVRVAANGASTFSDGSGSNSGGGGGGASGVERMGTGSGDGALGGGGKAWVDRVVVGGALLNGGGTQLKGSHIR